MKGDLFNGIHLHIIHHPLAMIVKGQHGPICYPLWTYVTYKLGEFPWYFEFIYWRNMFTLQLLSLYIKRKSGSWTKYIMILNRSLDILWYQHVSLYRSIYFLYALEYTVHMLTCLISKDILIYMHWIIWILCKQPTKNIFTYYRQFIVTLKLWCKYYYWSLIYRYKWFLCNAIWTLFLYNQIFQIHL